MGSPVISAGVFVLFYAAVILLALPGGTVLSLAAGYLFGPFWGTVLALAGATLGALGTLFVVRFLAADLLLSILGQRFETMQKLFLANPVRNLLLLRLIAVFPFFAVNIAAALLGVRARQFLWTTALGILPSTVGFAVIGSGLGSQLDTGRLPGPGILLDPAIFWPGLFLIVLVLLASCLRREI